MATDVIESLVIIMSPFVTLWAASMIYVSLPALIGVTLLLINLKIQASIYCDKIKAKLDITKQEVLQNLNSDILHFSCHGYFDAEDPFASGIVLKDEQTLTAREIFSYQIKAGLVTLSACETGISENRPGDELIGLTRSLLYAGAQSVVVSLWSASAVAAELTMVEFYSNLIKGDDKARALRKAQLKIRKELKGK